MIDLTTGDPVSDMIYATGEDAGGTIYSMNLDVAWDMIYCGALDQFYTAKSVDAAGVVQKDSNVSYQSRAKYSIENISGSLGTAAECKALSYSEVGYPSSIVLPLQFD